MKIDIYCDETLPDLFTSSNQSDKNLLIGSLWIESELREDIKQKIKDLYLNIMFGVKLNGQKYQNPKRVFT